MKTGSIFISGLELIIGELREPSVKSHFLRLENGITSFVASVVKQKNLVIVLELRFDMELYFFLVIRLSQLGWSAGMFMHPDGSNGGGKLM